MKGLDILIGLWSGERFSYSGDQYQLNEVCLRRAPCRRRAYRGGRKLAEQAAISSCRPLDRVRAGASGQNRARDAEVAAEYAAAGCTWWIEDVGRWRFGRKWEDQWSPDLRGSGASACWLGRRVCETGWLRVGMKYSLTGRA